jgi:hypothetical protein
MQFWRWHRTDLSGALNHVGEDVDLLEKGLGCTLPE